MKISEFIKIKDFNFLKSKNTSIAEINSWNNSLPILQNIFYELDSIRNCEIILEYKLPYSHDRVDVVLIGKNVIFLELKQWSDDRFEEIDSLLCRVDKQYFLHPCKQVEGYKRHFELYCDGFDIQTAVFMHNLGSIFKKCATNIFYKHNIENFKNFLEKNLVPINEYNIKKFINCNPKPTSKLIENLNKIEEVVQLSSKQKEVIYKILKSKKDTILVEGIPGSGKSLIALMLHRYLNKNDNISLFFTKTATPRKVYSKVLQKSPRELGFVYMDSEWKPQNIENTNVIIIDEAQRLQKKHIDYLKSLNKKLVFFYDSKQKVYASDIGDVSKYFEDYDKFFLDEQYRCDISQEYLDFIDTVLYNKKICKEFKYEFIICKTYDEFMKLKEEKNARVVSGYCFEWKSKNNKKVYDFKIENYKLKWNDFDNSSIWIVDNRQKDLVGCIHSIQGMEEDYIGVIVCDDLDVDDNKLIEKPKNNEEFKKKKFESGLIKNIYRVLLTRARKGTFVYFTNKKVEKFFKEKLNDCLSK